MRSLVGIFSRWIRLAAVTAAVSVGVAGFAAPPKDATDSKVRLMGDALRARDSGDLLAARKAITELSALAPNDGTVRRLREEIEAQIASMKTATEKIASEKKPQPGANPDRDGAIDVQIPGAMAAPVELASLAAKRVSFFATRAFVGDEDKTVTVQFSVEGQHPRLVLIRGVGPTLKNPRMKKGFLAAPFIELMNSGDVVIKANSDWKKSGEPGFIAAMVAAGGGIVFDPASGDAAIVTTLAPGGYSVRLSGLRGKTGLGVVEIYQFTP
ncbi:MAG TPA: hypothetical protein VHO24_01625 [Opitutaceae bacterium]|nr:hypothetical protein [Opitutaceae bacterium]